MGMWMWFGELRDGVTSGSAEKYLGETHESILGLFSQPAQAILAVDNDFQLHFGWGRVPAAQRLCPRIARIWQHFPQPTVNLVADLGDVLMDLRLVTLGGVPRSGEASPNEAIESMAGLGDTLRAMGMEVKTVGVDPATCDDSWAIPGLQELINRLEYVQTRYGARAGIIAD